MLVKVMGSYAALYLFKIHALYPCCGRIAASLRGPKPIKLLCSFGANAGICGWRERPALRGGGWHARSDGAALAAQ